MARIALALALLLVVAAPVPAQVGTPFACEERALDLANCTDPSDLQTCPAVCQDPDNPTPETCGMLPLPELEDRRRLTPTQPILRQALVTGGPYIGASLSLIALNQSADTIFTAARNQLCVAPQAPPTAPSCPDTGAGNGGQVIITGPVWYGGNPGLVTVAPRFR
jgi:hypothetical protein